MTIEDEVRAASDKFYSALNRMLNGDASLLGDIWFHSATVTTMHPIGGREVGWDQVRGSWEQLAQVATQGQVRLSDQFIQAAGDMAYELGVEHPQLTLGGQSVTGDIRVAKQQAELLALAEDLPRLWQARTTSAKDRKRMLRLLIMDLTIEKSRTERKAILHIRWQGGAIEDLIIDLPLPMPIRIRYPESIVSQVRILASTMTDLQIAATLNQAQLRSATDKPFTKDIIKWIRYRYAIPAPVLKRPEEFTVKELAAHFQIGIGVVHYWIQRGLVATRRLTKTAPYWLTIDPQKESELRAWVTGSSRIKMQPIPKDC